MTPKKTARTGAITDLLKKNKDCGLHTTHLERLSVLAASSGTLGDIGSNLLAPFGVAGAEGRNSHERTITVRLGKLPVTPFKPAAEPAGCISAFPKRRNAAASTRR